MRARRVKGTPGLSLRKGRAARTSAARDTWTPMTPGPACVPITMLDPLYSRDEIVVADVGPVDRHACRSRRHRRHVSRAALVRAARPFANSVLGYL